MEILLRVHEKAHENRNLMCAAGDVVVVCPDGWQWSELERKQPFWRILRIVGMTASDALLLTQSQSRIARRVLSLDLRKLPQAFINDDSRSEAMLTISADSMRSAIVGKALTKVIG